MPQAPILLERPVVLWDRIWGSGHSAVKSLPVEVPERSRKVAATAKPGPAEVEYASCEYASCEYASRGYGSCGYG